MPGQVSGQVPGQAQQPESPEFAPTSYALQAPPTMSTSYALQAPEVPQDGAPSLEKSAPVAGAPAGAPGGVPGYGYPNPGVPPQQPAPGMGYGYPNPQQPPQPQQGMPPMGQPGMPPMDPSMQGMQGMQGVPPMAPPMGQSMPGQSMPGQPMPGQPMPGQPMPGQPMPGQPMPGQPMPQQPPFGQPGYPQDPYQQDPYQQGQFAPQGPGPYPQGPGPYPQDPYAQGQPMPGQPDPYQLPPMAPPMGQPMPGMPPARSGPPMGLIFGAIGGVVALALIIVVAVVAFGGNSGGGGGGGGGNNGTPTLAAGWKTANGTDSGNLIGSWITDKNLIRVGDTVSAYSLADGSVAWTVSPPSGASVPCGMSPTVSSAGVGTIAFGSDDHSCTNVVGVDTTTGRELWNLKLNIPQGGSASQVNTFISGTVATITGSGVIGGVDLTSGNTAWQYKPRGQYCNDDAYSGGGVVLVNEFCADVNPTYVLTALDGATGKQLWQKTESDNVMFTSVLNGSPLVAQQDGSGGQPVTNIYDSSGNATPVTGGDPISANGSARNQLVVRMLNSTTMLTESQNSSSNPGIEALNVSNGQVLWTYYGQNKAGATLALLSQTNTSGQIYAISQPGDTYNGPGGSLVQLDPTTGKATVVAGLPSSMDSTSFVGETALVAPGTGSAQPRVYLVNEGSELPEVQELR
ncbi:outer membrane protein assembly factor BamB family protein [Streptacidiphilus fuscans]|uniref:PQQ-binding-like beta-propeller repeat protein n=1 Tax=Streptacidiphilus fuscans TaxID=2789292 RepID=A0A931BBI8_9ACTN|nr:PQQ-binding-like beta-propeller repeat protein [Streptacidiphilus fuscans]MBF9070395.1 PQQ-binding-like beta-propeller repeat protein [Streptacidiphilus fuscans]